MLTLTEPNIFVLSQETCNPLRCLSKPHDINQSLCRPNHTSSPLPKKLTELLHIPKQRHRLLHGRKVTANLVPTEPDEVARGLDPRLGDRRQVEREPGEAKLLGRANVVIGEFVPLLLARADVVRLPVAVQAAGRRPREPVQRRRQQDLVHEIGAVPRALLGRVGFGVGSVHKLLPDPGQQRNGAG